MTRTQYKGCNKLEAGIAHERCLGVKTIYFIGVFTKSYVLTGI